MNNLQTPGEKAKKSGEYIDVGPRGGKVSGGKQYTMDKNKRLPAVRAGNKLKRIPQKKK